MDARLARDLAAAELAVTAPTKRDKARAAAWNGYADRLDKPAPTPAPTPAGPLTLVWHFGWTNGNGPAVRLRDYPSAVQDDVDVVAWGIGQSATSGTGLLTDPPRDGYASLADLKADVDAWTSRGKKVILGIGGSGDGGIRCFTVEHADQMTTSINRMVRSHGFAGVSLDLEGGNTTWTVDALLRVFRALKAAHGPAFFVDLCVGMWGDRTARWIELMKAAGDAVDVISVMLYDFDQAADSRIVGVTRDKVKVLTDAGIPAAKIVPLYAARPTWSYPQSTPTPELVAQAVAAARTDQPKLGGYGWWDDKALASRKWEMATGVTKALA